MMPDLKGLAGVLGSLDFRFHLCFLGPSVRIPYGLVHFNTHFFIIHNIPIAAFAFVIFGKEPPWWVEASHFIHDSLDDFTFLSLRKRRHVRMLFPVHNSFEKLIAGMGTRIAPTKDDVGVCWSDEILTRRWRNLIILLTNRVQRSFNLLQGRSFVLTCCRLLLTFGNSSAAFAPRQHELALRVDVCGALLSPFFVRLPSTKLWF
mmetsp:Transcript_31114/g.67335  ORF Transcript_31114/g.67335 Transcript_31114/m.67335 type:complete len:204 (+) Transcript_31114:4197-4808(+)